MNNELKTKIQEQLIEELAMAIKDLIADKDPFADVIAYQANAVLDKVQIAKECFEGKAKMHEFGTAHDAIAFALPIKQETHEFLEMKDRWIVFTRRVKYEQLSMFNEAQEG